MASGYEVLPTVQEVLQECNKKRLVREVVDGHVCRGSSFGAGSKRRMAIEVAVFDAIEAMCAEGDLYPTGVVVIPRVRFALDEEKRVVRRVRAACLSLVDNELPVQDVGTQPWGVVLAYSLWMGCNTIKRDKYALLAELCWSMLRNGSSAKDAAARLFLGVEQSPDAAWLRWVETQWDLGEEDPVQEEYELTMSDLVDGWNEDEDIHFLAEACVLQEYLSRVA